VTVEDTRGVRLEVSVDSARAGAIAVGSRVPIALAGVDGPIDGTVSEIAPALDAIAHAFIVKIDLPPHPALRSGVFGRARFTGVERAMLTIPASAVVRRGQLTLVYVDDNGTARMRFVRVGEHGGDRAEILAGVSEGDRVVTSPPAHLRDGSAVRAAGSAPGERER
jgi:RND family efflux transporter MFP subunit